MQGKRKTKVGRVVSDKMDKTIVVSVERLTRHRLYKRVIRLTTKFKAHDETNDAHVGDTVLHRGVAPALGDEALAPHRGRAARRRPRRRRPSSSPRRPRSPRRSTRAAHPGRVKHDAEAEADAEADAAAATEADGRREG